jgi:hypothetical protein
LVLLWQETMMRAANGRCCRWAFAATLIAAVMGTTMAARADDDEHEWKHKRRYYAPYYVVERPVPYYVPPPLVVYSPPPMVVYPAAPLPYVPYGPPAASLNINIPLR